MARAKLRTREERHEAGKALREKCPRLSHGKIALGRGGKRDIVALINASNEGRLEVIQMAWYDAWQDGGADHAH